MTGGSERSDGRQAHVSRHSAGDFFNVPTTSMYSGVSAVFSIPLSSFGRLFDDHFHEL